MVAEQMHAAVALNEQMAQNLLEVAEDLVVLFLLFFFFFTGSFSVRFYDFFIITAF